MPLQSKPSAVVHVSIGYITLGAVLTVWSGIWYWYLQRTPQEDDAIYYWCAGFLLTGVTLVVIGLGLGWIGRQARKAELPPKEGTPHQARVEQTAASRPPVVPQPVTQTVAPFPAPPGPALQR